MANTLGAKIKLLRETNKMTQEELAKKLGTTKQSVSNYETGKRRPDYEMLETIADTFNVNMGDLLGTSKSEMDAIDHIVITHPDLHPIRPIRTVPILGTIACGTPIWAEENYEDYVGIDPDHMRGEFALYCRGDSMIDAEIYDGDLVFFNKTPDVENGTIAAVLIENEATLKKVYKQDKTLILQPCNSSYTPIVISAPETDPDTVSIIGECVGVYHVMPEDEKDTI